MEQNIQYNVAMLGDEGAFEKARVYMQNFMPFERGNPDGWALSKEDIRYVGKCQVLKALSKDVAVLAAKTLRNIEGLLVLNPSVSELEVS